MPSSDYYKYLKFKSITWKGSFGKVLKYFWQLVKLSDSKGNIKTDFNFVSSEELFKVPYELYKKGYTLIEIKLKVTNVLGTSAEK